LANFTKQCCTSSPLPVTSGMAKDLRRPIEGPVKAQWGPRRAKGNTEGPERAWHNLLWDKLASFANSLSGLHITPGGSHWNYFLSTSLSKRSIARSRDLPYFQNIHSGSRSMKDHTNFNPMFVNSTRFFFRIIQCYNNYCGPVVSKRTFKYDY
jgi:hypothetical protein